MEFITFELHLWGEASFGAASFLGSSCTPPPAWLEQRGQPHPASNLARSELKASRRDEGGGGPGVRLGSAQGLSSLGVVRGHGMWILWSEVGAQGH